MNTSPLITLREQSSYLIFDLINQISLEIYPPIDPDGNKIAAFSDTCDVNKPDRDDFKVYLANKITSMEKSNEITVNRNIGCSISSRIESGVLYFPDVKIFLNKVEINAKFKPASTIISEYINVETTRENYCETVEKYEWIAKSKYLAEAAYKDNTKLTKSQLAKIVLNELNAIGIKKRGGNKVFNLDTIIRHGLPPMKELKSKFKKPIVR